jgi:uncharacterized protein (TIGR02284 family)
MTVVAENFEGLTSHDQKTLLAVLTELHQVAEDAYAEYVEATKDARSAGLQALFAAMAEQWRVYADELQIMLRSHGRDVPSIPTRRGKLHELWTHVRAAMERGEAVALIAECERTENHALKKWDQALTLRMSDEVEAMLLDQKLEIGRNRDDLDRMRHPY